MTVRLGKPPKVPAGKLDINISATCDSAHASSSDDDTNSTDPGTTDPGNGQNPEDNLWNNEDFDSINNNLHLGEFK